MQLPALSPPGTPRDRHLDTEYWTRWIAFTRTQLRELEPLLEENRDDPVKHTAYRYEIEWRSFNTLIRQLYSGGYSLADVSANVEAMFDSIDSLDAPYRRHNPRERYGLYGWGFANHYELALQNLCWLICLGHRRHLDIYLSRCNPAGDDRLYDLIAAQFEAERPIATRNSWPKRSEPLLAVLDAPDAERGPLLVKAFKTWKRRLPDRGAPPTGVDGSYAGYWYWDAALVAALFGIDDGALANDGNYPSELVTHYRSRNESCLGS